MAMRGSSASTLCWAAIARTSRSYPAKKPHHKHRYQVDQKSHDECGIVEEASVVSGSKPRPPTYGHGHQRGECRHADVAATQDSKAGAQDYKDDYIRERGDNVCTRGPD